MMIEESKKTGDSKLIKWSKSLDGNLYSANNQSGERLGYLNIRNVGRHMHWCWSQMDDIYMSTGYLQEVRDKQKELYKNRKQ